jgi:hypothetical protein
MPASIHADECFWPLPVIKSVMLVWTIKSGLDSARIRSVVAQKTENYCADAVT